MKDQHNLSILGMEWQNSTFGQKGTAPLGGTTGEISTAAFEGQPDEVSAVAEPVTRIPCLKAGGYVKIPCKLSTWVMW
jgi:hypothetical protein